MKEMLALDATVRDAALSMIQHRVGSVLLGKDGDLRGIFTESDLVAALADGFHRDTKLEDLGTWPVVVARPDDSILEVMESMDWYDIRHMPVMDLEGELRGFLSDRDLLFALSSFSELLRRFTILRRSRIGAGGKLVLSRSREHFSHVPTAGDLCWGLFEADPGDDLAAAARALRLSYTSSLFFPGEDPGIFTVRNLVGAIAGESALSDPIEDWVSRPLVTCPADTPVSKAGEIMAEEGMRHLVVTGEKGPVGVIADIQLVELYPQFIRELNRLHELD